MLSILTLPTPAPLHLLSLPCRKPPPPFHSPLKKRKPPGTGRIFAHFEYLLSSNITFLLWETFPKHTLPMPLSPSHTERFFSESLTLWYSSYSILPVPLSHSSGQDPQGPLFLICSKPLDGPAALEEQEGSLDCSAWKSGREMSGDAVVACGGRAGCGGKEGGEKAAKELSVVWVVNVWVPVEVDLYHGKDSALLWRIIENKEDDPIPKNVIIPDSDPLHLCQFGFPLWLYLGPEPQWAVLLGRKTNSPGPQRFCPWGSCPYPCCSPASPAFPLLSIPSLTTLAASSLTIFTVSLAVPGAFSFSSLYTNLTQTSWPFLHLLWAFLAIHSLYCFEYQYLIFSFWAWIVFPFCFLEAFGSSVLSYFTSFFHFIHCLPGISSAPPGQWAKY